MVLIYLLKTSSQISSTGSGSLNFGYVDRLGSFQSQSNSLTTELFSNMSLTYNADSRFCQASTQ